MAREEERDPERREAAARARGEEEEEEGEEGLSDSDDEDQDQKSGSGEEEEKEAAAAAGRERSENARLQSVGLPPASVPAAAARDRSGRRPLGPLPCLPRMPSPEEEDRERRRSRRRDLLLSQLCFLALVALLLWSLSSMQEHNGECSLPALSGRCGSSSWGTLGWAQCEQAGPADADAGHEDSHCSSVGLRRRGP